MWDLKTVQVSLCICLVLSVVTKPSFGAVEIGTLNKNPLVLHANFAGRSQSVESPSDSLQANETLTRKITGGEARTFVFKLNVGQCGELAVHWKDIDLNILVRKPDQKLLFPTSISVRGAGRVPVILIAEQTGIFSVEVRTVEQVRITGSFDIELLEPRNPSDADRDRFSALMLMTEAQPQDAKSAIEKYTKALELWRSGGDSLGEAHALQRLGNAYISSKNLEKANEYYQALIQLRESLNDARSLIYTRREIGQDFRAFNSPTKAIEFYLPALQLARQIKDRRAEAALLYSIGFAHQNIPQNQDALKSYQEALPIQQENHDRLGEARTLNAIGGLYNSLGDQNKALGVFEQVTQIYAELNDPYRAAIAANNIGLAYDDLGDLQKAKDKYLEALAQFKSLLNNDMSVCKAGAPSQTLAICNSIANTSDNIGELYNTTGDPQSALELFQQSLPIRITLQQPRGRGSTLTRIGYSHELLGEHQKAIEYCEQAVNFNKTAEDRRGLASSFTVLGIAHAALSNMEKALEYYESALNLQRSIQERRGEGITLNQIGSLHLSSGQYEKAIDAYKLALQLWKDVKDQNGETITLFNIARLERDRGNLFAAHEQIQRALTIVENQRAALNSQQLVASYFASKQDYYELATDVAMSLGRAGNSDFVALALEISERARGRRLLDALAETRVIRETDTAKLGRDNSKLKALVQRQSVLRTTLRTKANALTALLSRKHTPVEELAADKEIKLISDEYDEVEARIKALDPAYATLAKPKTLTAKEMQVQLDTDTLLLEYSLGDKRSYVWIVTNETVRGIELAPREQIEPVATRLLHAVTARNREEANETPIQRQIRWANADKEFSEAAAALSKLVIGPVASMIGNGKRLVVVADGALQLVPFAFLPQPASPNSTSTLIAKYEIVSLPSASVLALQRKELANREPAPLSIALLADPVFDLKDQRVASAISKQRRKHAPKQTANNDAPQSTGAGSANQNSPVAIALRSAGLDPNTALRRLSMSRDEATDIYNVAPTGKFKALDFDANRKIATSDKLSKYRYVHFATHGVVDLERPELSGIVLSMVDEQGKEQDGYLRLYEIYNLNLPAELVVLSACQTGVGKRIRGEGLIALTRGFMYAGAARVVASLWKVDDSATAELMTLFYKEIFTNGKRPAAALRDAQIEMSKRTRWQSPYYWAGFVLQGEWR